MWGHATYRQIMGTVRAIIVPYLPKAPRAQGRPHTHSQREILEEILWKLRSGERWALLPDCYPLYQTCHW